MIEANGGKGTGSEEFLGLCNQCPVGPQSGLSVPSLPGHSKALFLSLGLADLFAMHSQFQRSKVT